MIVTIYYQNINMIIVTIYIHDVDPHHKMMIEDYIYVQWNNTHTHTTGYTYKETTPRINNNNEKLRS